MSEKLIPVDDILDPEWNSRLVYETGTFGAAQEKEIADLAESIKNEGQLQAGVVEGPTPEGKYLLVIGSRRLAAVKAAGLTTFRADVQPPTDESTRVIRNITENVKRKDLSQFEQARACVKLKELGLKIDDVGKRLGFSKQKVSNLAVSYVCLQKVPRVIDLWRTEHPAATVDFLRELATIATKSKSEDEAFNKVNEAWDARVKLLDKAEAIIDPPESDAKGAKGKTKPADKNDPPFKVPAQRYFDLVRAIQKSKIAGGKLVIESLKYAVGETDKIKGIIEPEAPVKE